MVSIEYPSFNRVEKYIEDTFKYAKTYYNQIKKVYDVLTSDNQNEEEIKNSIIAIGKEIYNIGSEEAISGCIVIMILTNNIMLNERFNQELLETYQQRVEKIAEYWSELSNNTETLA